MSTFLILGGTGKVGRRLGQSLTTAGHVVRAASRHGSTHFDWSDPATWPAALAGTDGVFVVGPGSAKDWSPALASLLATARSSGVRHAVLLSARGVEFLPGGAVALAEQALRQGPLSWTILRPSHFAQNFTEAMFVPVDGLITAPVGTGAEPFIDTGDVADVAAAVLASDREHGKAIDLSGPEAITFAEAATILTEESGTPVRFADESDDSHIAGLRAAGTPEGYVEWRMAMLGGIRRGADAYVSDGVQAILGRPPTAFRNWARREVPDAAWARAGGGGKATG